MPLRQLCAAGCAALALLMIAVGAPLMDDLGFFAVIAASCYFAAGWVAHGGPRIAFAGVPSAVCVTLVLLPDFRFTIDIVPSLLNVAGAMWGFLVTADRAKMLAPLLVEQPLNANPNVRSSDGEGQSCRAVEDGGARVDLDSSAAHTIARGEEV
jgi:hypothetical protein